MYRRTWTRRRLMQSTLAAGVGLSGLALFGCSDDEPAETPADAPADTTDAGTPDAADDNADPVTVTWAVNQWSQTELELVQKVAAQFESEHPNYKVTVMGYDPETYDQRLLTDISAGTLPDIFVSADVFTEPFFESGLTADLTPFAARTGLDLSEFDPKFLDLATYEDQVGFLPRAADVVVTYYNKRMFDEAGLDYPAEDWTYDDMLAAAEQLTKRDADGTVTQYGVTANYTWWAYWVPMVVAEGGQILSDDLQEAVFNSPEGIRAWNIIFTGLQNEWFVPPSVQDTMGGPYVPFATGNAAMTFTIRGLTPTFRDQLEDDWDVQLVPRGSAERRSGMGTMGYAMSATAENPDAAWDVLHYTYTEGMKVFMETYLLIPPIETFYDDPTWRDLPGPPYNNEVFVAAMDFAMLPPPLPFYTTGAFGDAMEDGLDAVLLGQMSPEEAINRMAEEATRALQR